MSEFARRKATSALSYLGGSAAPMVTLAPELLELRETFFVASGSWENSYLFFLGLSRGSMSSSAVNSMATAL